MPVLCALDDTHTLYSLWFMNADSITPESTGETNTLVPLQSLY
jgi:hypothetical protein